MHGRIRKVYFNLVHLMFLIMVLLPINEIQQYLSQNLDQKKILVFTLSYRHANLRKFKFLNFQDFSDHLQALQDFGLDLF